jgi:hypothetical protein
MKRLLRVRSRLTLQGFSRVRSRLTAPDQQKYVAGASEYSCAL